MTTTAGLFGAGRGKGGGRLPPKLPRVPKGQAYYDAIKKRVTKGGEWMRRKLNGYQKLLKKGEKLDGEKMPGTSTSREIRDVDRSMEELIRDYGRFLNDHVDPPMPGG